MSALNRHFARMAELKELLTDKLEAPLSDDGTLTVMFSGEELLKLRKLLCVKLQG